MMVAVIRKVEQRRKEEERENERLKKRQSSATSSRPDTSMSYHRSNTMYGTPEPSPPYELPENPPAKPTVKLYLKSEITGPFKHMINPHADVENLDSRPLSRGGWATLRSQLPPLRGSPRDADPPRPTSRNTHSPRPVSRGSFLTLPSGLDSLKPQSYTGRESPRETDIRPKTALNRRESRPGTSVSRPRNFPPQLPAGGAFPLYYVDISPSGLRASVDMTASLRYERFDVLVGKANAWLAANADVFVINCETVETRSDNKDGPVDTSASNSYDNGEQPMYYHRSLRLWIRTRTKSDPPGPQSVNFINIVPQCLNPEGFNYMESPEFETLGVTISKFNTRLSNAPLKGKIINVETLNVKFTWGKDMPDCDKCQWDEDGQRSMYSVAAFRVFFQDKIRSAQETIGIMDFVPNQVKAAYGVTPAVHETIEETMTKVNDWLKTQEDICIVNLQTVEYSTEASLNGRKVDTMVSLSRESRGAKTRHLRFIRVYFTKEPYNGETITYLDDECKLPICFSYRTFQPEIIQNAFENQRKTLQQAMSWVKMTDAKVACCETVQVRMEDDGTESYGDPEATLTQNSSKGDEHVKYVLRVYLDGVYHNPIQLCNKATIKSRSCTIL